MKVIINKSNGLCIDVNIHCALTEFLIISHALRLMAGNKNINEANRKKAEEMCKTIILFCERKEE